MSSRDHAEIVKDKQREAAKAVYVFVPALVAGGKVAECAVFQTGEGNVNPIFQYPALV